MNSNYPLGAEFDDNAPWKQINYNAQVIVTLVIEEDFEFNPLISEKELNYEKLINLHDRLLKDKHFSCFEHCRKVMSNEEYYDFVKGFVIDYDENGNKIFSESSFGWCENYKGFISYKNIIENKN